MRIGTGCIETGLDHEFHAIPSAEELTRIGDKGVFGCGRTGGQAARNGAEKIDRRETPPLGDPPIKDDMPVENPTQDIGNRFIHIRPGYEH